MKAPTIHLYQKGETPPPSSTTRSPFRCLIGSHVWGVYDAPHVLTTTVNGAGVTLQTTYGQTRRCAGCGLVQTTPTG